VKGQDILIVEDENIVALDMRMRLESMGYRVVDVVDTAALAIERVAELSPELVLMDIKLKGEQDGIEAATLLRERSEVPVIFVTAFTDERTLDRAKRASPYGYIVKPFHERELRIAIELAIYKHQYELSIRRAKDIAEESNRLKGDFLANMSHELKTPLNSVIGFTELAMAASREREQKEHLAIALSSAKSLLTLIDSILDFARMEAGKLLAVSAPFSLDELLDECADSLAIAAFPKGLAVSLRRDPAIPDTLVGDGSLLKHVLLNLLDNAVKFTDAGRVRIAASLHERPELPGRGPTLRFEVSDTGIGMARDKIGLAFARFSQLDPSKTRKAGGTGLGLAIVAKSVELMGGDLSVESEIGSGTRFTLLIPFEQGAEEPERRRGALPLGPGVVAVAGFDEEGFSDASMALSRLGYEARKAGTLAEAAAYAFALADELVVADTDDELLDSLATRLIVATRLGGDVRSRLAGRGIAFSSAPLRSSGLRRAFHVLAACRADVRGAAGSPGPRVAAPPAGGGASTRAVEALERAAAAGALDEAERWAKEAQGALLEAGDKEGSRLAFAALLAARKGDIEAMRATIARMRETAERGRT
jgi:two-component system, sensor histidine kinase